jgi:iron complex transport system substrate-binding protein
MTVVDGLGRKVTLPHAPQRIVSLAPKNTEMLFAIGAGDQVVAVTSFCNYPPEAKKRQRIGGFSTESQSLEQIVALKPDLVVAADELQWPVINELERLGVPIVSLGSQSLAELYHELELLGRLTGRTSDAARLTQAMQRRVERVAATARTIPPEQRVTVFYHLWSEPLMTAGPGSFAAELIAICGGLNIAHDAGHRYPQISQEVLLARDPEVILAPSSEAEPMTIEYLRARPGWSNLRAVRNNRIHLLDGDLVSRCGPRLVDALEIMARVLYPDRFTALADRSPRAGAFKEEPRP